MQDQDWERQQATWIEAQEREAYLELLLDKIEAVYTEGIEVLADHDMARALEWAKCLAGYRAQRGKPRLGDAT